jgi:putative tricarboxylic transport membrane protein
MKKLFADTAFAMALLVGATYLWFVADGFQRFPRYKGIDMDFWPKILFAIIVVLAVALIWQNIANIRARLAAGKTETAGEPFNWAKLGASALLVVAYFIGLQTVGFMIATVVFLFLAIRLIGYANRLLGTIYPFAFTALVTLAFVKVLELPLPRGMGLFESLSRMFY